MNSPRNTLPSVAFRENALVLERGGTFALEFLVPISNSDINLIIDIYDLDNAVHPNGHVGWWRYNFEQFGQHASGRLIENPAGGFEPSLEGSKVDDSWQNPERLSPNRLVVIAVLRSSVTNAILSLRRIPAFRSEGDLAEFRASASALLPSATDTPMHYVLPADSCVHLVAPNIFPRDAVGNLFLGLRQILKQHQADVGVFADSFDLTMNDIFAYRDQLPSRVKAGDAIIYSFSTYDAGLNDLLDIKDVYKICYFHGITQPRLLQVFDPELSIACAKGIKQIPLLAQFDCLVTNSKRNLGYLQRRFEQEGRASPRGIAVIPPVLINDANFRARTSGVRAIAASPQLLYVGRIKSHKKIEDILHLLSEYRKLQPSARCTIAGRSDSVAYQDYLRWVQTEQLKLPDEAVNWLGSVSEDELAAAYASASAYISMSEDEGFCIPVFEAMTSGVPVFAYNQQAVREMLGGAGVLFNAKSFEHLARQLNLLLTSPDLRGRIVEAQLSRARAMRADMDGRGFMELLFDRT